MWHYMREYYAYMLHKIMSSEIWTLKSLVIPLTVSVDFSAIAFGKSTINSATCKNVKGKHTAFLLNRKRGGCSNSTVYFLCAILLWDFLVGNQR